MTADVTDRPDQPDHDDEATRIVPTGAVWARRKLASLPFEPEDLTEDWRLQRCERREYEGYECPHVGAYPILRSIGAGGMGDVYAGVHPRLGTPIAIKLLRDDMARRDQGMRARFLREAQLAAQLSGTTPHLVHVIDVDVDEPSGAHFLVMEYVDGVSARQWTVWVQENVGPVAERDALDICVAATTGLAVAHRAGVIHRDVKSDNILLPRRDGEPAITLAKLADLGLARDEHSDASVTATGVQMIGTPGFAAPEQLESAGTARKPADVFGMGATLYELLTGTAPFPGNTSMARAVATLRGEYIPVSDHRPGTSEAVAKLLENCLQLDPDARYQDADALLEALQVCRAAASQHRTSDSFTMKVMDLLQKSEVGRAVSSALASGARSGLATLAISGGPPGTTLRLIREDDEDDAEEFELDDDGRANATDLEPGAYLLRASHRYHHDFEGRVRLREGAETHFLLNMRETVGSVSVDSEPRGASVRSGRTRLGRTPLRRARLVAGEHELVFELEGYGTERRTVLIPGPDHVRLDPVELHAKSRADLSDQPGEIEFLLDGEPLADGDEIEPGTYTLEARRPGYASQTHELVVARGRPLKPELGSWRLNAWALVETRERWLQSSEVDRNRAAIAVAKGLDDFTFLGLHAFDEGGAFGAVAMFRHGATGLEFVLLPGDDAQLGSPVSEEGRRPDERERTAEVLPFLIATTVVPRRAASDQAPATDGDLPLTELNWAQARAWCTKRGFALPSEDQWEYACRGGRSGAYSFGDDPERIREHGWCAENSGDRPRPVGTKAANDVGLHDLHGGVWEWCETRYREFPDEPVSVETPGVDPARVFRVFRGGSWASAVSDARSARRGAYRADYAAPDLGFRPIVELTRENLQEPEEAAR